MASQKISQLTAVTSVASGDYFPIVEAAGTTNKRVGIGVLDVRYTSASSGVAAQSTANTALASGNAAGITATAALSSGNAALASAATKYAISGGVVSGQFSQNIVSLGLYGSGINCNLGNYFVATLSGNTQVTITNPPSSVAFGFTYEVNHQTGTISWPSGVVWPAATAPTLTTGRTHLFMFVTDNNGVTWRASSLVDYTS